MDWLAALNTFFKLRGIYAKGAKVAQLYKYGKKLDPKKLTWDDLKYFKNKQMTEATAAARETEAALDKALATKVVWPETNSDRLLMAAFKSADKNGLKDAKTQKALDAYQSELSDYDKRLKTLVKELEAHQKELPEKIKTVKAMEEYGDVLHDAFMTCAKVPNPLGTAANASFFSLAQDARQFSGVAGSVHSRLLKLKAKNAEAIAEGKDLIKSNEIWIAWIKTRARSEEGAIKKNLKAVRPK